MTDEERAIAKEVRSGKRKAPRIIVLLIIFVLICCTLFAKNKLFPNREEPIDVVSEISVRETIEKSDLSTVKYTHNAVVTKKDKKGKEDAYYIAYKGIIKAGIDLDKVDVKVYKEKKKITVTVPEAKITKVYVEEGDLDFIFKKRGYETETVYVDALIACQKDLRAESKRKDILEKAGEESKNRIRALIEPWANGYTVEVK